MIVEVKTKQKFLTKFRFWEHLTIVHSMQQLLGREVINGAQY